MSHRERIEAALARAIKSGRVPMAIEIGPKIHDELLMEQRVLADHRIDTGQAAPIHTDVDFEKVTVYEAGHGILIPVIKRDDKPSDYINILS